MDYSRFQIFRDISDSEVEAMIHCFHMRRGCFQPGETVCAYGGGSGEVGVVIRGAVELVRFDYGGTRTLLERLETGAAGLYRLLRGLCGGGGRRGVRGAVHGVQPYHEAV